jgi:hypothetical protein
MKTIPSAFLALLLLVSAASSAVPQTPIKARTESGKEVILSPDGTWKYVTENDPHSRTGTAMTKPAGAKSVFKGEHGGFSVWYDDTKWLKASQPPDAEGRTEFKLKRGDGYAIVIVEELGMPTSTLKELVLENARSAAPDTKIVFEESRTVNGKEVLCLKMEGSIKGINFRYFGYYHGGKNGSIQVITYTATQLFAKYEQDFLEFLNGLQIDEPKM